MIGITSIKIATQFTFDDGNIVTFSTPDYTKDIRHGDLFTEEELQTILVETGQMFANAFEEKSIADLHKDAQIRKNTQEHPYYRDKHSNN